MKNSLYIISNDKLNDTFYKEVMNHLDGMKEFMTKHGIKYDLSEDDYQETPVALARDGHLVVKFEETSNIVVFYIPRVVNDEQNKWLYYNMNKFANRNIIGGFVISHDETEDKLDEVTGLDKIIRIMNKRNMLYEKKEDEENARKKI